MKAGREVDNLMATEVMGWELLTVGYFGGRDETARQVELEDWLEDKYPASVGQYWIDVPTDLYIPLEDWKPSTDIAMAMRAAKRLCNWDVDDNMLVLKGQGPDLERKEWPNGEAAEWWEADIQGIAGHNVGEADKPAMAICLATLKVKGINIDT